LTVRRLRHLRSQSVALSIRYPLVAFPACHIPVTLL
jgi:hypothetical protein